MAKKEFHIDKKQFYIEIKKYLIQKEETPDIEIPEVVIGFLLKLGRKYLTDHKFYLYDPTIKKSMLSEGMYSAIRYIDKFQYKLYNDPFSYFTTTFRNSFFKVLNEEKKNKVIKRKIIDDHMHNDKHNHKLKEYLESNPDNVYFSNEDDLNAFVPLKVINKNGEETVFETEKEWLVDTYRKLDDHYDMENLPKYKQFNKVIKKCKELDLI